MYTILYHKSLIITARRMTGCMSTPSAWADYGTAPAVWSPANAMSRSENLGKSHRKIMGQCGKISGT